MARNQCLNETAHTLTNYFRTGFLMLSPPPPPPPSPHPDKHKLRNRASCVVVHARYLPQPSVGGGIKTFGPAGHGAVLGLAETLAV